MRVATLLLLLGGASASARPGMGGGYVGGGSRSGASSYSHPSSTTSSSSSRTGTATPRAPVPPTADEQFNADNPMLRYDAELGEATFQLRDDGRMELVETFPAFNPSGKAGIRFESPLRVRDTWLPSPEGPLSDGVLSGRFEVASGGRSAQVPLEAKVQYLRSGTRKVLVGRLATHELPPGTLAVRGEVTFVPARVKDELSWTWEFPPGSCTSRASRTVQLRWPAERTPAAVEVFALDAEQLPGRAVPVAVRTTAEGHAHPLPACDLTTRVLFTRATFAPGVLPPEPRRAEPANVLSHVLHVRSDGSIHVTSRASLEVARPGKRLHLGGRGPLASSWMLHPVNQLYVPLPWAVQRGDEGGAPTLSYRALGNVGEAPGAPSRGHLSFAFPYLLDAGGEEAGIRESLHDARVQFDDPRWLEQATPTLSAECYGDEACEVDRLLLPRAPLEVLRDNPGELHVRFVQGVYQRPWQLELDLPGGDPTRLLPGYPLALAAHVMDAGHEDAVHGAGLALAAWLGILVSPLLAGAAFVFVGRRRARATAPAGVGAGEALIREGDPSFSWNDFEGRVKRATTLLMHAWSDGELERARHVLSAGVYQRFLIQLRLLRGVDGVRNVMREFEVLSAQAAHVGADGGYQVVHVRLRARARDVTVPAGSSVTAAEAALGAAKVQSFEEIHTWVRRLGTKTVAGRDAVDRRECPGCGAPADVSHASTRCGHCGVVFNAGEADWVLSEITQVSEWNGPREAKGPSLPEGLCRGVLEDRAAALFWRALQAGALGEEPLRPFTAASPGASLGSALGPAAGRHASAVVGGVTLAGVKVHEGGMLRATFDVRWSSRRVSPVSDGRATHRRSVMTLELAAADRGTVPVNYADASDCAGCGAPAPELYAPTCGHCGGALPVRVRDWRLVTIE